MQVFLSEINLSFKQTWNNFSKSSKKTHMYNDKNTNNIASFL